MRTRPVLLLLVAVALLATATILWGRAADATGRAAESPAIVPFSGVPSSECPNPMRGPQFYAPPLPGARRTVALTFDDGPGPSTQQIIDILERFHVRASFMNIGDEEEERPSLVAEEVRDGFLVGDHTMTHPDMVQLSQTARASEVDGVIHFDRSIAATSPCVFRPPYGDYDSSLVSLVNSRRMTLWMWSVDTQDWMAEGSGSAYWVHRIIGLAESEGGALEHPVVLMHNQAIPMPATVAALPTVIAYFLDRGYAFVDLLGRSGPPGSCGGGVAPRESGAGLGAGRTLGTGGTLRSLGGEFTLAMTSSGLVVRFSGGRTLWHVARGHTGAHLAVERDGDVVVASPSGHVWWSTGTGGHPGARLVLGSDGGLAVEHGGTTLWVDHAVGSSLVGGQQLRAGWELASPNGECHLTVASTGDVVLRDDRGRALWRTQTRGHVGAALHLTTDGDVEVRSGSGLWWQSYTGGAPSRLVVLDTGQLAVVARGGTRRWITP